MSSLSNLPYGRVIEYWYKKLKGKPYHNKFLLTKVLEIYAFKKNHNTGQSHKLVFKEFPKQINNNVSFGSKFSIVVPVYVCNNEDLDKLNMLFQSILKLHKKPNKVFIIDDNSPLKYDVPIDFTLVQLDNNSGPAKARNIGVKLSLENNIGIIAFTDSDCILDENWVSIIKKSFLNNKKFNILSGKVYSYDKNWFGKYHEINGTLNGRVFVNEDKLLYGTTANLAITSLVASKIKFNENFPLAAGEDIEYCFKANMNGFAIKHIPDMRIQHNFGYNKNLFNNTKKFMELFSKYGKGETILLKYIPNYYKYFDKTKGISSK
jgi:GT2 family glycosyltransferase